MNHNFEGVRSRGQLQNVFRVLADPNHQLRGKAIKVRQQVSSAWQILAAQDKWFAWPTTATPRGTGGMKHCEWRSHGMLSFLEYHVGEMQPTPKDIRWRILEYAFECHLPPLNGRAYLSEWGEPQTAQRLSKMANSLATFTRNAKRRDTVLLTKAIGDWECDLAFLHDQYYVKLFHFGWPETHPYLH
jgi:hypothetical protein